MKSIYCNWNCMLCFLADLWAHRHLVVQDTSVAMDTSSSFPFSGSSSQSQQPQDLVQQQLQQVPGRRTPLGAVGLGGFYFSSSPSCPPPPNNGACPLQADENRPESAGSHHQNQHMGQRYSKILAAYGTTQNRKVNKWMYTEATLARLPTFV